MLQDLHSHSYYSYCGKDSPEDIIKNAIANNIEFLGISDHYYGIVLTRAGFAYDEDRDILWMHSNALRRYYDHIKLLAEKYRNKITVWCGVEITTMDFGYTLIPDGIDISYFDYCLIENFEKRGSAIDDPFELASRCGCKNTGFAHADLIGYIKRRGYDMNSFFRKMAENNIFWELNVNYDSIHGYRILEYVNNFFENTDAINAVKNSGVKLSVGFDSHKLEDYDAKRVSDACKKLEKLGIPMVK